MTPASLVSGVAQMVCAVVMAPLLPGLIQHWKARLQGRRGPSPIQPYRELRRLWGKSTVTVQGTTFVYRWAPSVAAASVACALLLVPLTESAPDWGVGHDVLVLAGLLALARFVVVASSWDTANGFSLMGGSRDLMISVFVEATLVLSLAGVVAVAGSTDLSIMIDATSGTPPWRHPVLGLAAVAFSMVLVAEVGRQPVDNPDTHLELTMIHEGPLLEYAGRDLAYLQWAMAARHWLMLVLASEVFLPHPDGIWSQLLFLPVTLAALCGLLALVETMVAKMRILRVPQLLATGAAVAVLGIAAHAVGLA